MGLLIYNRISNCVIAQENETFARLAEEKLDIRSLVRYELLVQAMALSDNINNNMYIWAHRRRKGVALWLCAVGHGSVLG